MRRPFEQVDVFSADYRGNPVAVVLDAQGLTAAQMQRFARWTNLSETTFVLPATRRTADYRVRIFTPVGELPFAGHPTLGTCHAWLRSSGEDADEVVQECAAGLVRVRRTPDTLAFAAPPLIRGGDVEAGELATIRDILGVRYTQVLAAQWVDNGPGWVAVLLDSVDTLLGLTPGQLGGYFLGAAALHDTGGPADLEVRAFFDAGGVTVEDPVTGSLNASLAPWLVAAGYLGFPYTARQGSAIGRDGRVLLSRDADGTVWVGGRVVTAITGTVEL
ncbi:MAG TPA: PhzF family phenazine biosynthesis protein [Actinomycetota bacterium]|nr:PhzF family phenazine biosynthesis protein [Actinomycetota bacterium]